ncbi:DNA-binding transcriptional dual regulator PhoB [Gammaproteobacteria bacterium]
MNTHPKIMVVEDEMAIQELLRHVLTQAGFDVSVMGSAELALAKINEELPASVLVDWMLPGISGPTLVKRLRANSRTKDLPILMVTARGEEQDRIAGLETGADDYVSKPFSPKELVARVRAVLRRRAPHYAGKSIEQAGVYLNPTEYTVTYDGKKIALAPTEFELLQFLMHHPNHVFTRDQLLNALRGDHRFLNDRTIDVYIRRLRSNLGEQGETLIETVRGVGYKFTVPRENS